MYITIKGNISDGIFDDFLKLIELHKFEFFGQYDTDEIKGDLMQNKYPFENLKPFLINFCNRSKLEMIVSNLEK